MRTDRLRCGLALAFVAMMLAFAADAADPAAETTPAAQRQTELLARVVDYWKARVARNPSVRDYYPPPEKRPEHSRIGEGGAVHFDSFEIADVAVEGDSAVVTLNIASHIEGKTPFPIPDRLGRRTLSETWSRIDGAWYKQPSVPAMRAAADDLQRAFLRRRAAEAAARAESTPNDDRGTPEGSSGSSPVPNAGPGP